MSQVEATAVALWRADAIHRNLAKMAIDGRTLDAFREESLELRERWLALASAAIEIQYPTEWACEALERANRERYAAKARVTELEERIRTWSDDGQFIPNVIIAGMIEGNDAMRKYPQPNYVLTKFAEEAGEFVKACVHHAEGRETIENVRSELIQTIAMLYRLWEEGDGVHGLDPIRRGYDG